MQADWLTYAAVGAASLFTAAVAVLLHYQGMVLLGKRYASKRRPHPHRVPRRGTDDTSPMQATYMSAVTFTTVGFGNVSPLGPIRLLAATEALVGFMLITWSASFTFLHMSRYWAVEEEGGNADDVGERQDGT